MTPATPRDHDGASGLLIERATSAWRPRDLNGRIQGHPAWHDLSEDDRATAYRATVLLRRLEAAIDRSGLTSTARSVLARVIDR